LRLVRGKGENQGGEGEKRGEVVSLFFIRHGEKRKN